MPGSAADGGAPGQKGHELSRDAGNMDSMCWGHTAQKCLRTGGLTQPPACRALHTQCSSWALGCSWLQHGQWSAGNTEPCWSWERASTEPSPPFTSWKHQNASAGTVRAEGSPALNIRQLPGSPSTPSPARALLLGWSWCPETFRAL